MSISFKFGNKFNEFYKPESLILLPSKICDQLLIDKREICSKTDIFSMSPSLNIYYNFIIFE